MKSNKVFKRKQQLKEKYGDSMYDIGQLPKLKQGLEGVRDANSETES